MWALKGESMKGEGNRKMKFGYEDLGACPVEFPPCGTSYGGFHRVKNQDIVF